MNYVCPIHGPHVAPMCTRCLMDIGAAMNPWASSVVFTSHVPTFSDPHQQSCDRAEVEAFIASIEGVR